MPYPAARCGGGVRRSGVSRQSGNTGGSGHSLFVMFPFVFAIGRVGARDGHSEPGTSLPGFKMFCGSKAALIPAINRFSASLDELARYGFLA